MSVLTLRKRKKIRFFLYTLNKMMLPHPCEKQTAVGFKADGDQGLSVELEPTYELIHFSLLSTML